MLAAKRVGDFAGEPAEGTLRRVHDVPTLLDLAFLDSMGLHEHRKSPAPKALQSEVSRGRKKDIYNNSRQPRQGADADYLSGRRKTIGRPPSGPEASSGGLLQDHHGPFFPVGPVGLPGSGGPPDPVNLDRMVIDPERVGLVMVGGRYEGPFLPAPCVRQAQVRLNRIF